MQHGPERDQILESFKIFNEQFEQSVSRARADLQEGRPLEDLILGGSAEFAKTASIEALSAVVICRILKEALKPVPKPRRKTSVPAKRAKIVKEVSDGQSAA